jgi:hypothetical protein
MERKDVCPRYQEMLKCFTLLPHKILSLHGIDNMTELVLHTLCNEECLNLSKAAYFIDNPDFDCLKGIAGFDRNEEYHQEDIPLDDQSVFSHHLSQCAFNKKVRGIQRPSFKRRGEESHNELLKQLAGELDMGNPIAYNWNAKHDNYGILLFERDFAEEPSKEFLEGLSLLGFCPVC